MKSEFLLILLFLDILFFLGLPGLAWVLRVVASFSERNSVFSIASSSNIHCSFDFSPSCVLTLCMALDRGLGQVMSSFSPRCLFRSNSSFISSLACLDSGVICFATRASILRSKIC